MIIKVTREDIKNGAPGGSAMGCPVALAISRDLNVRALVTRRNVNLYSKDNFGPARIVALPKRVSRFTERFDVFGQIPILNRIIARPFKFELEI